MSAADVSTVPARYRGQILSSTNVWIENALVVVQAAVFLTLSLVPAILGGLVATGEWVPQLGKPFWPALAGLAAGAGFGWVLWGFYYRNLWALYFMLGRARAAIDPRSDALVRSADPNALFVEIIPKRNWGQVMLQNAEDIGFLVVDADRNEVRFEGDHKRYRIQAGAILSSAVETMGGETPVGMVVLAVSDSTLGERELPVRPVRFASGKSIGKARGDRAAYLSDHLLALRDSAETVPGRAAVAARN